MVKVILGDRNVLLVPEDRLHDLFAILTDERVVAVGSGWGRRTFNLRNKVEFSVRDELLPAGVRKPE